MKVKEILSSKGKQVWTVTTEQSVYDAIKLMADKEVGALPVTSAENLVGIVSERDYARKILLQGRRSRETPVSEIMTPSPITVSPQHDIDECLGLMTEHRCRHLPVVEGGKLLGIISIGDLVKTKISHQNFIIDQLETYIKG